ncbi:MAG TPA: hypothetical protein PKI03_36115, partial [Pseudomonadota bacterium]|nr:hypothetical protein [Pseudomonadota bacterium]
MGNQPTYRFKRCLEIGACLGVRVKYQTLGNLIALITCDVDVYHQNVLKISSQSAGGAATIPAGTWAFIIASLIGSR